MKKILSIALCAAAVSAFGDTTPTEAVLGGEIGVTAITSSLQNTIVAVSYDDLDSSVTSGIAISNLVKTANLEEGDQLAIYVNGEYTTWRLAVNGSVKYWEKNTATFTIGSDGQQTTGKGEPASDVTAAVGTGIWLCRATKPTGSFTFYIYGKPSTAKTITTTSGVWNLVGNPTQGDVTITDAIVSGANNDEIRVPGENGLVNYLYKTGANDGKGGWCRAAGAATGELGPAPIIGAGMGFWIKTANAVEIRWQNERISK